jgi:AcrR family transcriptional regulator
MDEKKEQIMLSAVKLFANQGYASTSMQEIAKRIGIAKGTLYLHFSSKDDLLLAILKYYQDEMLEKVSFVLDDNLPPKERLERRLNVQFREYHDKGDFVKMHIKEQVNHGSKEVQDFMSFTRRRMLNFHKQTLLAAYGERIRPFIWDVVLIYSSMIREYMNLLVFEKKPIAIQSVTNFIASRIDAMIQDLINNETETVLTSEMMKDVEEFEQQQPKLGQEEILLAIIKEISVTIKKLKIKEETRRELQLAVNKIQEEIMKNNPTMYMVHAMLAYLESKEEIKKKALHLRTLIDLKYNVSQ